MSALLLVFLLFMVILFGSLTVLPLFVSPPGKRRHQ